MVRVPGGEVEVVQHHHDGRAARPIEVGQQVEYLDLVADVQKGRGFVEQQHVGLLRERHRDPHPLPLTPRQFVDGPIRQIGRVRGVEGGGDGDVVVAAPPGEDRLVRMPAPAHEVRHRDAFRCDGRLRQETERARQLLRRQAMQVSPVEEHAARSGGHETRQGAQQGRLPARIGSDDGRDAAGRDGECQRLDDVAVSIAERQGLDLQLVGGGHNDPPARLVRMIKKMR
jgi:hypothetical protein